MKIRVDYREKASGIVDLLKGEDFSIEIGKISYGDYIIKEYG